MSKDFAVLKLNGKQYVVSEGDVLKVDRFASKKFEVMLAQHGKTVVVGEPTIKEVGVVLTITQEPKDKKISVRRFKSKSRYRKNKGHRQPISIVRVEKIGKGVKNKVDIKIAEEIEKPAKVTAKKPVEKKQVEVKPKAKATNISELDITDRMKKSLEDAGYKTTDDLKKAKKEDLINIKGFGEKAADKVLSQI